MLKRLLNQYEEVTCEMLRAVCAPNGARVYAKVRLADIFPIEGSGISSEDFRFALQSHVDSLVVNQCCQPEFCVEFDGPTHKDPGQVCRDKRKNGLFERFDASLLRINSRYLTRKFRGLDLLTYFVEVWFLANAFYEAQENGGVPYDEPFDPASIMTDMKTPTRRWPYWLSLESQLAIQSLHKEGRVASFGCSDWIGQDKDGNYRCLAWLYVTSNAVVFAKTGMHYQRFRGVDQSDLLSMIARVDLYEELLRVLNGAKASEPPEALEMELDTFQREFTMCAMGLCGPGPRNLRVDWGRT